MFVDVSCLSLVRCCRYVVLLFGELCRCLLLLLFVGACCRLCLCLFLFGGRGCVYLLVVFFCLLLMLVVVGCRVSCFVVRGVFD